MINGFYNSNALSKINKIRFIKTAIEFAYSVNCQSKFKNNINNRYIDKDLNISKVIDDGINHPTHKLDCIDRFIYNQNAIPKDQCEYEICLHYDWTFLYIFINEENFNKLITKFELKLIDW